MDFCYYSKIYYRASQVLASLNCDTAQEFEVGQHLACSQDDRGERVLGNRNRQSGLLANAPVQIFDQRSAAGEHDTAVADVGAELRRSALQRHANRVQNGRDALG